MQLSNVAISSSKTSHPSTLSLPSPYEQSSGSGAESKTLRMPPKMSQYQSSPGNISSSFKSIRLETVNSTPIPRYQTTTPSGLSLLLATRRAELLSLSSREAGSPGPPESSLSPTLQPHNEPIDLDVSPPVCASSRLPNPEDLSSRLSEEAPLLAHNMVHHASYSNAEAGLSHPPSKSKFRTRLVSASHTACARSGDLLVTCVRSLPAVLLGALLNVLDGVSCELFESTL